mgnify:CR=1 FL=1
MPRFIKRLIKHAVLAASCASLMPLANAQQNEETEWWFDVELIAFKRIESGDGTQENFAVGNKLEPLTHGQDILSIALLQQADPLSRIRRSLPLCSDEGFELDLACQYVDEDWLVLEQKIDQVPIYLRQANQSKPSPIAHLLDGEDLYLAEIAKKLFKQRDIAPLLHIEWRQAVEFGEQNAPFVHLFAGKRLNITDQITNTAFASDSALSTNDNQQDFFNVLEQALLNNRAVVWQADPDIKTDATNEIAELSSAWELDGLFKVFLKYINRVPYLHIDSEFRFHELFIDGEQEARIKVIPFKQRRRIISKQIHYFDHPKMGIIVRLERYEPPQEVLDESTQQDDIERENLY